MKILCLGGSRFLGPLLVNQLLEHGHQVAVANRGTRQVSYIAPVQHIQIDRNQDFAHLGSYDVVVDTCAYRSDNLKYLFQRVVFDFFIFISTVGVYKKTGFFPLSEDSSPLGVWPLWGDYNKGKIACEMFLADSGVKYASVRPVYILGSNNHLPRESFIYTRLIREMPITLPGNGESIIQFVFVDEVATLVTKLVEKRMQGAFNCAGNDILTLQAFVEKMADIVGVKPKFCLNPNADGVAHQPQEFPFANESFFCANQKARNLGIEFESLYNGLKRDFEKDYKFLAYK